jgi:AcrR family transcriptional regulator
MKKASRKTREQMSEETTGLLIEAARRSFAAAGYHATSMDELCAEVGLTRGALYHHFGGKEGLFEAVVIQIDQEVADFVASNHPAHLPPLEAFKASCFNYLGYALNPEYQQVFLTDAPSVLGARVREIDQSTAIGPISRGLSKLMDAGLIRIGNPVLMAIALHGGLMELATWISRQRDQTVAFTESKAAMDIVFSGLALPAEYQRAAKPRPARRVAAGSSPKARK